MRICILTTSFPRYEGDYAGCFIFDLTKKLAQKGFHIAVLAPSDTMTRKNENRYGINIIRFDYFPVRAWQKLTYNLGMPYNLKKSLLARIQFPIFFFVYAYKSFFMARRSDIIWSHWLLVSGLIGALWAKVFNKTHVVTIHSTMALVLYRFFPVRMLVKFIINNSQAIIVVSPFLRKQLLGVLPLGLREIVSQKLYYIPMGIETNIFGEKDEKKYLRQKYRINTKYVILFLGRLVEFKGLNFLIEAVKGFDDCTLVISGVGDKEKALRAKADNLGIKAKWTGLIIGNEKLEYLRLADLLIVPSFSDHHGVSEGLPVVILEAFASGKPVIGSNVGGIGDVIRDGYNGFLVPQRDAPAISERLSSLFNNAALLEKMGRNALDFSKNFDIDLIADKYEALLN